MNDVDKDDFKVSTTAPTTTFTTTTAITTTATATTTTATTTTTTATTTTATTTTATTKTATTTTATTITTTAVTSTESDVHKVKLDIHCNLALISELLHPAHKEEQSLAYEKKKILAFSSAPSTDAQNLTYDLEKIFLEVETVYRGRLEKILLKVETVYRGHLEEVLYRIGLNT